MNTKHLVVLVTAPPEKAPELARTVVQERLAACANIVPAIRSIYAWKGEICDDSEALMVFKTRAGLFEALRQRVVDLHPYEVPEVVSLPLTGGHAPYLAWLDGSTREP